MKKLISTIVAVILIASMSITSLAASGDTTVYITRTGEKYHLGSCSYLRQSKIPIALADAVNMGYTACCRCDPPALTAQAPAETPAASASAPSQAVSQSAAETAAAPAAPAAPAAAGDASTAAAPAAPTASTPGVASDPDTAVLDAWFAALAQVQAGYLTQWNLLVQQNAADSDPVLAQRVALVNQTMALPSDQMIQQLSLVSLVQLGLSNAGCFVGEVNGLMDLYTIQSLILYQQLNNLPATGALDASTLQALGI